MDTQPPFTRAPRHSLFRKPWRLALIGCAGLLWLHSLLQPASAQMLHSRLDDVPPEVGRAFEASTGLQQGRMVRNGLRAACGNNKAFPGVQPGTGARRFDVYRLRLETSAFDPEPCMRFTLRVASGGQLMAALYDAEGFDPANLGAHYVADSGDSAGIGTPTDFSAALPGGVYYLVVAEVDAGTGGDYDIEIEEGTIEPYYGLSHPFGANVGSSDLIGVRTGALSQVLLNDNVRSRCSEPLKPTPDSVVTGALPRYVAYAFRPLESGCLTVRVLASSNLQLQAYTGDFDPAAPTASFAGGYGGPLENGHSQISIPVQANQLVTVVLHELFSGSALGESVVLTLLGVEISPDFSTTKRLELTDPIPVHAHEGYATQQTGRLSGSSPGSGCGIAFPTPALATASGSHVANVFRIRPGQSGCLRLSATYRGAGAAQVAVYERFDYSPSNPRRNYHAQPGQLITEIPRIMSFPVVAGENYDIVIHESLPGSSNGGFYSLHFEGPNITPTIRLWTARDSGQAPSNPDWQLTTGTTSARLSAGSAGPTGSCIGALDPGEAGTPADTPQAFHRYRIVPTNTGCLRIEIQAESLTRLRGMVYTADGHQPEAPLNNLIGASALGNRGRPQTLNAFVTAGEPIDIVVTTYDAPAGSDRLRYRMKVAGEPVRDLGLQLFADGFEP